VVTVPVSTVSKRPRPPADSPLTSRRTAPVAARSGAELDAVRAAQAAGVIDPELAAGDVYSLVISLSMT
jgi:hypothetical protein